MTWRKAKWWLIASVATLFCLHLCYKAFWLPTLTAHEGDGNFTDLSRRAGPFAVRGYSIKMPVFDMGNPFQAEYQLAKLPNIGLECEVYLAFDDPEERFRFDRLERRDVAGGEVRLELVDSNGGVRVQVDGKPRDFIWYGFRDTHALYKMDHSFFSPDYSERYTLRISYAPDPKLAGLKGYAYLLSGGRK